MSEVIENYIRRHPGVPERDAFEGFLQEERIRSWVGSDESRRERLRKEFTRVYGALAPAAPEPPASTPRSGPSGPTMQQPRVVRVEMEQPKPAQQPVVQKHAHPTTAQGVPMGRKLQVMCTRCSRVDVWMDDEGIFCRQCGHEYDDMLQLIRVTPVGPFEFVFGEGWKGAATATGIGVGLIGLYYLLRGL